MLMNDEARKRWVQYAKENLHIDPGTRWKQFYELNKDELDADYKKIEDRRKEKAREYYQEHKAEIKAKKTLKRKRKDTQDTTRRTKTKLTNDEGTTRKG